MNTLQVYRVAIDVVGKVNKIAADLNVDKIKKDAAKDRIRECLTEALKKLDE